MDKQLLFYFGADYGALNNLNDPDGDRRRKHARLFYEEIRNSDREININAISKNSKLDRNLVETAYHHVFEMKHQLINGYDYFAPSYDMAESWRRLHTNDNIQKHDILLVRHEALEYQIWKEHPDWDYYQAHEETCRVYDYHTALEKWKGEH